MINKVNMSPIVVIESLSGGLMKVYPLVSNTFVSDVHLAFSLSSVSLILICIMRMRC